MIKEAKAALIGNADLFDTSQDRNTGLMVAFYPTQALAAQIAAMRGVEIAADDLHVTLAYYGNTDALTDEQIAGAILAVQEVARYSAKLSGNLNGIGRFNASAASEGRDVIYGVVDTPGLDMFRSRLVRVLADRGLRVSGDHGFNPHITLAYVDAGSDFPMQTLPTMRLDLGTLTLKIGDKRADFPMTGEMRMNQEQAAVTKDPTTLHFVANALTGSAVRKLERGGKQYLVAPVVTINEGVLNGELVRASEFQKYIQTWQGRPVTIGHPQLNGTPISANSQDVLDQAVGALWNVVADGTKKRGELWLDIEKCNALGGPAKLVLNKLEAGEAVEVSTGYFRDLIDQSGEWNGKPYNGIAVNLRPDHLAILLDEAGACSWKDGCGAPRINQQEEEQEEEVVVDDALQVQAASQSFISELVRNLLKTFGGKRMDRNKTIQGLVANCRCKLTADQLSAMDDGTLVALSESLAEVEQPEPKEVEKTVEQPAVNAQPTQVEIPIPKEIVEFSAMIQGIGGVEKLGAALSSIVANADRERSDLVAELAANEDCVLSEEELNALSVNSLKRMASKLAPKNYFGNAGVAVATNGSDEYVLEMPNPFAAKEAK
jgi:2'-5' RNA ligase